ncbi:hypothetical protein EJB05_15483, partial [Eragrostis curvula]
MRGAPLCYASTWRRLPALFSASSSTRAATLSCVGREQERQQQLLSKGGKKKESEGAGVRAKQGLGTRTTSGGGQPNPSVAVSPWMRQQLGRMGWGIEWGKKKRKRYNHITSGKAGVEVVIILWFTGASGSSSSAPPDESPATSPPELAGIPAPSPPPPSQVEDYELPPPNPPPDPTDIIDLEEEIDDEEYARRLHVALNKGPREIPASADIISIDDSSDDEHSGEDAMYTDVPASSSPAEDPASVIPLNENSVLHSTGASNSVLDSNMGGTHISSRVSLINSASGGGTENISSDLASIPSEDADERRN